MNCKVVGLVLALIILPLGPALADGPFGVRMGMTLNELGNDHQEVRRGVYKYATVPQPHSGFEAYIMRIGPTTGLCWIKAVGVDISDNAYGTSLRSTFSTYKDQLAKQYGKPKDMDFLLPGSIWNKPRDYMMALVRNERILAAIWDLDGERNLKQVGLIASALSRNKGYVSIEYSFMNKDACDQELADLESQAF